MPAPEVADGSFAAQLGAALVGIGSLCGLIYNAFRSKKDESRTFTETTTLEDDRPWLDRAERIEAGLRRLADNSDTILALMRKRNEEEERARMRAEARVEAQEEESRRRINDKLREIDDQERRRRRDEG